MTQRATGVTHEAVTTFGDATALALAMAEAEPEDLGVRFGALLS